MIVLLIAFSIILIIIGAGILGYGMSEGEIGSAFGMIPLIIGCSLTIGVIAEFYEHQQNDVSICISDNIKTVEEVKTDGSIVKYNITLKDGTEFTVCPQEKD